MLRRAAAGCAEREPPRAARAVRNGIRRDQVGDDRCVRARALQHLDDRVLVRDAQIRDVVAVAPGPGDLSRARQVLVGEPFLLVEGILQMQDGVTSVRAARVDALPRLTHVVPSHDFG